MRVIPIAFYNNGDTYAVFFGIREGEDVQPFHTLEVDPAGNTHQIHTAQRDQPGDRCQMWDLTEPARLAVVAEMELWGG